MKNCNFRVLEYYLGGTKVRNITIEAKTESSALKKLHNKMGDKSWDYELV